jgi:DNA-3-methyladenine glycosylase
MAIATTSGGAKAATADLDRPGAPLPVSFYARPVVDVARELLGCVVVHGGTSGVIVETEAYHDSEPACHAFVGLTRRTRTLFGPPGRAYVYRSYGVHALLNAVCEEEGVGAAVLIRALAPLRGLDAMRARRGMPARSGRGANGASSERAARELCSGPGKLTQALAIGLEHNDGDLRSGPVVMRARSPRWEHPELVVAKRVGITKGTELEWRFCVAGSPYVSRPRPRLARR